MPKEMNEYEVADNIKYLYGTAGFRLKATLMKPIAYRVGMMAAALSRFYEGKVIGIMLTASHNPIEDNGVKIVAPDGGMLPSKWEAIAEEVAHTPLNNLYELIKERIVPNGSNDADCCINSQIVIGRDTRPSGEGLLEAAIAGAKAFQSKVIDIGLVTTPELHMATKKLNDGMSKEKLSDSYINEMLKNFTCLLNETPTTAATTTNDHLQHTIHVDCSNGVGKLILARLIDNKQLSFPKLVAFNNGDGVLNEDCGADFIKTKCTAPIMPKSSLAVWGHYAALDGDADRLVYFTFDNDQKFILIDGDRIGCLCALTISKLLKEAAIKESLKVGIVQTAYANGGSTAYLNNLGIQVICTSTGVKYLHEAAAHQFDIGIYFEANGHGTILFNEKTRILLQKSSNESAKLLSSLAKLSNQLVGDGVADLFLVEAMLNITGIGIKEWVELYKERPSSLLKLSVNDRTRMITADADRKILEPVGLQQKIDQIVKQTPNGRAFARASGTEDVVRIFAEASTRAEADQLARTITDLVHSYDL